MPDMCLSCYVLIGNICYRLLDRFVDLPENEGRIKEDVNPHQQVLPILAVTTSALPLFNWFTFGNYHAIFPTHRNNVTTEVNNINEP